ncbi:MAG: hypothetical protein M3439_00260 [Chloroflexota bacterium]|nr:hypothetical protein [Chloroflexota bacterium]
MPQRSRRRNRKRRTANRRGSPPPVSQGYDPIAGRIVGAGVIGRFLAEPGRFGVLRWLIVAIALLGCVFIFVLSAVV